jgi:predicted nucleic acid-binding protein
MQEDVQKGAGRGNCHFNIGDGDCRVDMDTPVILQSPKAEVIEKVSVILGTENLFIPDKDVLADALVLYARKNIDFIDAYNAVFMKYHSLCEICSYDEDFETIEDIERKEP